jgi:hypothetical protein
MDDEAERAAYADADVPERHCQACGALIPYGDRADSATARRAAAGQR